MTTDTQTRITAIPAGRDRHGNELPRRAYTICREPEDWGDGRSRIWAYGMLTSGHHGAARSYGYAPWVVKTASIETAGE